MLLKDFLAASVSTKTITVNLFDEKGLLLIVFNLPGYSCLDDNLEERVVKSWSINNLTSINVNLEATE